ncbi:MAG: methyltransferase domain-containing protein [archaeon]|nr:methyltransferase domain-containing protein [archaeon]
MQNDGIPGNDQVRQDVREYYGHELKGSSDLKTNCCCCGAPSREVRDILALIDDEILDRFYGCGSPIPPLLEGMTVLDLGSGTGRDVYIASKLVGETGRVIGVDMTAEQIEIAERHRESQRERFGYARSNVEFRQGFIEDLRTIGIEDESIDVVISNCVINLSPEKEKVFSEIHRVLKKGGELYFSDVFADRRVSAEIYANPVLRGECLGGAMYVEDFRRLMNRVGFADLRYMSADEVRVDNPEIRMLLGDTEFYSCTVRAFKLDDLEDCCENYGQVVIYRGNIPNHPDYYDLDAEHRFHTNKPKAVCGNTCAMIQETRYSRAFTVRGDRNVHYGKFDCEQDDDDEGRGGSCCCCCN